MKIQIGKLRGWLLAAACIVLPGPAPASTRPAPAAEFEISVDRALSASGVMGRLILVVTKDGSREPRLQIGPKGPAIFAMDVEGLDADDAAIIDARSDSYPLQSLRELPGGDYFVQALLVRYTSTARSDGHTVAVPISPHALPIWQHPGNLYSEVRKTRLDVAGGFRAKLVLASAIPDPPIVADTEWIKGVRIQSRLLSEFWGTPMYIGARVLLPRGYESHPDVRYPSIYVFGHGQSPFFLNTDPASHEPELARARDGNLQTGYEFYRAWKADGFPRVVAITLLTPTPYFPDSYGVNSANNGPYGDAILQELIPFLERKFRLIAQPHARIVEGASTGGWEALALQLRHADFFGGAWVFNPDPIDFTRYQRSNIYEDENMFSVPVSAWVDAERPDRRDREGQVLFTVRQLAQFESVLGSRGRSGYQYDGWQATHGPVGADGYPVPLFDKRTGAIDRNVVRYMREQGYDLIEYTRSNWPTLGPKLVNKLNFFAGEQDDYFLNLAVYQFEDMLRQTRAPHYAGRFEYGRPKRGHNWHLTDFSEMVREMAVHIRATAPPGEDHREWNY